MYVGVKKKVSDHTVVSLNEEHEDYYYYKIVLS